MKKTAGVDIVFFDPDNGIEIPSKPIGRKGSSKFVAWNEIKGVWNSGCSILIYQHFNRKERMAFAECLISELRGSLPASLSHGRSVPPMSFSYSLLKKDIVIFTKSYFSFPSTLERPDSFNFLTLCKSKTFTPKVTPV